MGGAEEVGEGLTGRLPRRAGVGRRRGVVATCRGENLGLGDDPRVHDPCDLAAHLVLVLGEAGVQRADRLVAAPQAGERVGRIGALGDARDERHSRPRRVIDPRGAQRSS